MLTENRYLARYLHNKSLKYTLEGLHMQTYPIFQHALVRNLTSPSFQHQLVVVSMISGGLLPSFRNFDVNILNK